MPLSCASSFPLREKSTSNAPELQARPQSDAQPQGQGLGRDITPIFSASIATHGFDTHVNGMVKP